MVAYRLTCAMVLASALAMNLGARQEPILDPGSRASLVMKEAQMKQGSSACISLAVRPDSNACPSGSCSS